MCGLIVSILETGAVPNVDALQTKAIQNALDKVFLAGGGTVTVPAGKYNISSVRVRSNTMLYLESGAELYGSRNPELYNIMAGDTVEPLSPEHLTDKLWEKANRENPFARDYSFMRTVGSRWNNGMIRIAFAENVAIVGESGAVIDGCDCYDAVGEERYRGPHGVSVWHSKNVTFSGYTIRNTGNWAHAVWYCKNLTCEGVTAEAGHDGIHMTRCENIVIRNSHFYTGDDCVAGFGNLNTLVEGCTLNTACSGLRFGGTNALIRNCHFYGPAKFFFRGSLSLEEKISGAAATNIPHRINMLSVLTYYADFSVEIPEQPDNIVITDCTVENTDRFLHFNFSGNETWQKNRPLRTLTMSKIKARGISMPLTAYGSPDVPLIMTLKDIDLAFREGARNVPFLHTANYERIVLENVNIDNDAGTPVIKAWTQDGEIVLRNVECQTAEEARIVYTDEPFVCKSI